MARESQVTIRQLVQMGTESPHLKMECLERNPGVGAGLGPAEFHGMSGLAFAERHWER